MEWLQAPEGGGDDKRNSFVDVHPESKKLLSQIGLWQIVTGEEGGGGGGGRLTSRNRGWPNEADDDTPSLTSEDERRYWEEVKVGGCAHAPRSPQRPAPTTKIIGRRGGCLDVCSSASSLVGLPRPDPPAKPHRQLGGDARLSPMPIAVAATF